jgi:hypothetical protein
MRLANDAVLAERVAAHRWMARQIVAAYGPPPEAAVDECLVARFGLGDGDGNVVAIADSRRPAARRVMIWTARIGAITASLVIGILVGQAMFTPRTAMTADTGGRLMASGVLADRLSNQLAGELGPVHIGASFRTESGICRTFRTEPSVRSSCRYWLADSGLATSVMTYPASKITSCKCGRDLLHWSLQSRACCTENETRCDDGAKHDDRPVKSSGNTAAGSNLRWKVGSRSCGRGVRRYIRPDGPSRPDAL